MQKLVGTAPESVVAGQAPHAPAHAPASSLVLDLLRANQESLRALQAQQEQTARIHQLFLEGQQHAQASFHALLTGQHQLSQVALGGAFTPPPAPEVFAERALLAAPPAYVPPVAAYVAPAPAAPAPAPAPAPALAAPAPAPAAPAAATVDVVATLLDVIVQTTGYPREILVLTMEMEADLGIDSIKRVEILSLLSKRIPGAPSVNPEKLGSLKTLQNVVDFIGAEAAGTAAAAAPLPALSGAPGAGAPKSTSAVTRHVVVPVRLAPLEQLAETALTFPEGDILVTPDASGLADALVREWTRLGARARIVTEAAAIDGPVGGLVLLPPAGDAWSAAHEGALKEALRLARTFGPRLIDAASRGAAIFASVSRRDGAFGHASSSGIGNALAGGLAGLVKTVSHEWPGVSATALDVADAMPLADAAREIVRELGTDGPRGGKEPHAPGRAIEIGIGPAGRTTLALHEQAAALVPGRLERGDVVVVTGGARGVTAHCARALAEEAGVSLLLLGRSPLSDEPAWLAAATDEASVKRALLGNADPASAPTPRMIGEACRAVFAGREIRANLAALEALGVRARYAAVDIRDGSAVARVLSDARAAMGPLRGIVHGAGVLRDKRIADKRDEDIDEVVDTKLAGLRVLLSATRQDDLRFLGLFASVSGLFGRRGQSDYALANQALVSVAQDEAGKRPGARVVALDWGPWDGGMVTPALKAEFLREGVGLIPLAEGARALVAEAQTAPGGPTEIVLGASGFGGSPALSAAGRFRLASVHLLDPKAPVLADHQLAGKPVLPFAMALEWFAQAGARAFGGGPLVLEDARVLKGLRVDALTQAASVWAGPVVANRMPLELRNAKDEVLVRAFARTDAASPAPPSPLKAPAGLAKYPHAVDAVYESLLFHGPRLHAIQAVSGISAEGMALRLATHPTSENLLPSPAMLWTADPLAVDGIFQALILWCREHRAAPSLPSHIARMTQYRPFDGSGSVRAVVRIRETEGAIVTSDIDLVDAGGVVLRLEGYSCTVSATLDRAFGPELGDTDLRTLEATAPARAATPAGT
jgi:NADP-dependent 3-hydroxy acid dehydrogenase YdfG/acyl carrier protein